MSLKDWITATLEERLDPTRLVVEDESQRHAGHAGWREGGETHFDLLIVSNAFAGLSRVERQRRVNAALAEELAGPVHALSIRAEAPGER